MKDNFYMFFIRKINCLFINFVITDKMKGKYLFKTLIKLSIKIIFFVTQKEKKKK